MPGGFHPFHAGHYALYKSALEAFPQADVYVAATNDQSERPFPFSIKEKLAKLAGVQQGRFVQVKSPFQAKEITQNYDPNSDVLIFVRSEKDKNESPKPGGTKKDGSPAYFQPWTGKDLQPFSKHAYFAYLPTVTFGPGIKSATEIRNAWPKLDDRRKTAMVMSLYPATQKNPKLAQNVVQLLDIGMGGQLNEFAPGNGDDGLPHAEFVVYQCDPTDKWEFMGRPLYQTDNLGMAHKYAYEMYVKHRPKAFIIYQPHAEASRGHYGVKGQSDGTEVDEGVAEGYKEERLKGCKCQHRQGDNKKCPIHGVQEGVAEGSLEEVDRRGFLKGMGAAAVAISPAFKAMAQDFNLTDKEITMFGMVLDAYWVCLNYPKTTDPEKCKRIKQGLSEYAKKRGFSSQELNGFYSSATSQNSEKIKDKKWIEIINSSYNIAERLLQDLNQMRPFESVEQGVAEGEEQNVFAPDIETQQLLRYAQQHYPNTQGKQQAFVKFVQRALNHSEEDDMEQDEKIEQLAKAIKQLDAKVSQVTESEDYLEEK